MSENDWIGIKIDNIGRSLSPYQKKVLVEEATKEKQTKGEQKERKSKWI